MIRGRSATLGMLDEPAPQPSDPTHATVLDRPPSRRVDRSAGSTSVVTPEQAMRLFEARRVWTFAVALAVICLLAIGLVAWLGGDPLAAHVHMAGLAFTAVAAAIYAVRYRDPDRYQPKQALVLVYAAMVGNGTGFYYWGVYSGFLAIVTVSGYAFSSGAARRDVIGASVVCSVLFTGLGVAQLLGWVPARGLIIPGPLTSWTAQLVTLVALQLVLVVSIIGGVDARTKMQQVIDEHGAALRALSQRDAQLAEARAEVREIRAAGEGRYTGQHVGRFALGKLLGRGAMGEVYDAVDDAGVACAVKVLAANLLGDEHALRRFHREARVIASLDTPHIVRMVEVSPPGASLPFLAMERLTGRDLGDLIKERAVRDPGEVLAIVRAVAAGLDAAHEAGVIHRDLKPANLFAAETAGGVVWKILDFGVSKLSAGDATLTSGNVVGTPGYMAPEQARGDAVDRRADVYSLGVVAYRLLTGRPAVIPGDLPAMLHEVVYRMPPAPHEVAAVPVLVEAVLAVALAKSPADRFATAGELAAAFAEAVAGFASPVVAERAAAILARTPWGHWMRRGHDRKRTAVV
jgi:eukaryotic-like serine/threonine-protein kinase